MKAVIFLTGLILITQVGATVHVDDLKLQCQGLYEVVKAEIVDHGTCHGGLITERGCQVLRAPLLPRYSIEVQAQIKTVGGSDCQKLEDYYNFPIQVEDTYNYKLSADTKSEAQHKVLDLTQSLQNYQVQQAISFQTKEGELPLFPLVHSERVYLLGKESYVDSQKLYGTPEVLDDSMKLHVLDILFGLVEYGKVWQNFSSFSDGPWLAQILHQVPEDNILKMEYLSDLILIFKNASKYSSRFTSLSAQVKLGKKINEVANEVAGTPWSSQLKLMKQNPALFAEQVLTWASKEAFPQLSESDLEEFVTHAVEQIQILEPVTQIYEATVLKNQYKNALKMIDKFKSPGVFGNEFPINEETETMILETLQ